MNTDNRKEFTLSYSHNVIDHLGLKLYQNKPTRVIAELISNSWDADSSASWVEMSMSPKSESPEPDKWIAVHDMGTGMTRSDLHDRYLVIGAPKRARPGERTRLGRHLMGRKGIGKLAPFGIARTVDVVTVAKDDEGKSEAHWLRLNIEAIKAEKPGPRPANRATTLGTPGEGTPHVANYHPEVVYSGDSLATCDSALDRTGQVALFKKRIEAGEGTGTLILLKDLTLKKAIPESQLLESLGQRFTAAFERGFEVSVSGATLQVGNSLPQFEFRIPEKGFSTENLDGQEVRFWVGFVEKADWPSDLAGVGVYSHGKICQDRPFTFARKGKEIFTRYMYGVVEADWLDEQDDDLISTDRTSLNWEADAAISLHKWGHEKVGQWVRAFEKWRGGLEKGLNRERLRNGIADRRIPNITDLEQEQVADLLSEITPSLGKDEEAKDRVADAVASAWIQEPMRGLIKHLWAQLGSSSSSIPSAFATLVEQLIKNSVPESLNLAVVFAQRAFALSKLYDLVHNGDEVDLQRLIEEFPWIIEPDTSYLTANKALKTAVRKAEEQGHIPTGRRTEVAGVSDKNRPDFVFLSSPDEQRVVVVELKNPQDDLTIENRQQLADYLTFLETHYPDSELHGYLVGRMPSGMKIVRNDMVAIPWTEVMRRSRGRHITFLAAMLSTAGTATDARVQQVREFGGEEVWQMLNKMAESSEELRRLFDQY